MGCASIKDPVESYGAIVDSAGNLHVSPVVASSVARTSQTVGTTSDELVAARSGRRQIDIQNLSGANAVHIRLADDSYDAATTDLRLNPGERYSFPPGVCYTGAIQAIAVGASATVLIQEFVA